MNATEHLAVAEQLLERVGEGDVPGDPETTVALVLEAQGHALVAIADILGVAHDVGSHPAMTSANPT